ncbi:TATA element modulatory factor isoform X2 [Euwallacea fornicatus]|uniref:TATA element modulatory factor isoform X2 n=1 Tax=Euwallacea fornicatus TaxID=995702 RepID=UPI0033902272
MSWFDAGALANIAKSALKEAQKTIDKALDIKDEGENSVPVNTPIDTNSDDFFGTWGVTQSGNISAPKKDVQNESVKQGKMGTSIWESFTGSFFDNTGTRETHSHSVESLDDSIDSAHLRDFSKSKLVVQHSEEDHILEEDHKKLQETVLDTLIEVNLNDKLDPSHLPSSLGKGQSEKPTSNSNRLSAVSSDGSKNNSESVEVLTGSTECTTTPESDILSFGLSTSTSSSTQGFKQTSESVEILCDSLTSPSSVEIICSDSNNSRRHSQHTDNIVSPLEGSPSIEEKLGTDKTSPESVEIIPEDQDENSVAEDTMSYTSISESTSATVLDTAFSALIKPQKMLKDTYNSRPEFSETISSDTGSLSPDRSVGCGEAITRAPGRSMHLPLQQVNHNQILIDTQPQSINKQTELPKILENTNIIDIPQEEISIKSSGSETQLDTSTEDGSVSDKTIVEAQENAMESSSDTTSTTTETSSNSTYLKKMLADAMTEKSSTEDKSPPGIPPEFSDKASSIESIATSSQIEIIHRETSPLSSEKSDLVKIGSDHTSCHTSGDEFETTTSSDIEIISSPNGDSSSTQSRQSPSMKARMKMKTDDSSLHKMTVKKAKGHNREPSEASSISDDSHPNGDIDRLLKRISEMTEILESRESKLIDMNRRNAELQEHNSDLKQQLDCILTQQLESADLSQVTEEYTQRLSALEKKFQQAIRDKDSLRKQLDQAKLDVATRMSKNELEAAVSEKDEIIKELREEGEKLSKQQLQHSNIIKKLRVKEKEHENTIRHLKETNESLSLETERLKKSLSAKEDVERTQIEAVHNLTTKNKKLDNELSKLKSQLEDLTQKFDTTKKSLDAAKKELIDKSRTSSELVARQQLLEKLENEKRMTESQNEDVINQLDDLRYQLRKSEEEHVKKEQKFKQENNNLLRRLEEAENRNEELSQSVMEISKPLVRQLENLQAAHSLKMSSFEKVEKELTLRISDLQSKLQAAASLERSAREESVSLRSKLADMEGQLSTARHEAEVGSVQLEQAKTERQIGEQELKSKIDKLCDSIKRQSETIEGKNKEIQNLRQQLTIMERMTSEADRKGQVSAQSSQDNSKSDDPTIIDRTSPTAGSNSPTLSLGKASVTESLSSSFWSQDEPFEVGHTPRYTNMFEIQILQSSLKQRDGELQQLQWELNRREQERTLLNTEISGLINKVEELEKMAKEYEEVRTELKALQQQYETLCQLFGEKVEENEELKLDLVDVKDMYKSQIDELLRQQKEK